MFGGLFGAAVVTIGLTEYRPLLGGVGNLSDCLFLAAFGIWFAVSLLRFDLTSIEHGWRYARTVEPLMWAGLLMSAGGAIASFGSEAPPLSWVMTLKYFLTFCVWLPWISIALSRWVSVPTMHILYIVGLASVALASLTDVAVGTKFGLWLVSTPQEGVFENLVQLRYGGPTGHPTTLGYVAAIGFLLSLSYVGGQNSWPRSLFGACCLVLFGSSLLVSGSRAAFLGIAAGWLVILVRGPRGGLRRLLLLSTGCLAVLSLISRAKAMRGFLPVDPLQRLTESALPRRDFEADWERRRNLQSADLLLARDPVTGYGMENVGTSPAQTLGFNLHNTILQSWLAGGILTCLGAVWLYATVLAVGWRFVRRDDPLASALFAACVAFVMMDMVHPHLYMRFKWFSAALLLATLNKTSRSSRLKEADPRDAVN